MAQKKKPGPAKGTPSPKRGIPQSPEAAEQSRIAAIRHGRRAQKVNAIDALRKKLQKIHPHAHQIIQAYTEAVLQGRPGAADPVAIAAMAEKAILRFMANEAIREDGVTVKDPYFDKKTGALIGERIKAHPMWEHVPRLDDQLGFTTTHMQIDKKSRGEGQKDAAVTRELERRARLAEFVNKQPARLPPAPEPVDTEIVEEVPA